jgi:amino-acid N-acetyltransferase
LKIKGGEMMKIRPSRKDDLRGILSLIRANKKELIQNNIPAFFKFFVAEENGEVIGCCALDIYSKKIGEIRSLAVRRKYRGKGIATQLIQKCLKRAKERKVLEIFAITGKPRVFEKFGLRSYNKEKYAVFKRI